MAENITITANWLDGSLSNGMISRQYDNNRYRVQFINYPLGEDEDLSLYLIVWMKTEENGQSVEQAPIELDSDQWIITNYYTQFVQSIQFQLCVRNESGTFEAHSPIFNSNVTKSLSHDGSTQEIYVDPLFDAYKEYVDDLVIGAGAVVIDSDLDTAGAAADAKATGDAITDLNERLASVEDELGVNPPDVYTGTITEANVNTTFAENLTFERATQYRFTFSIPSAINTAIYFQFWRGGSSDSKLFSAELARNTTSIEKLYTTSANYDITEGYILCSANTTGVTVKVAIEPAVGVPTRLDDIETDVTAHGTDIDNLTGRITTIESELFVPPDVYTGTIEQANTDTIIAENLSFDLATGYKFTFKISAPLNTDVYFHLMRDSENQLFSKTISSGATSAEKVYTTSASVPVTAGYIQVRANATNVNVEVEIEPATGTPSRIDTLEQTAQTQGAAIDGLTSRTTVLESEVGAIDVSVNRLNPFTVTTGKYINTSGASGNNTDQLYTDYIKVNPGERVNLVNDGVCDSNTRFRYLTAYDSEKVVIPASGKETSYRYDVPEGVAYIIMTLYATDYAGGKLAININDVLAYSAYGDAFPIVNWAQRLKQYPYSTLPDYVLGGAWYKPLGSLSKGYFCFVTDDGRIGMNEYTIPTLVIGKGVKCTFAIMSASEVMADAEKIAVVKDAVDNYGCSVAQHGGNRWTSFNEYQLNEFFDTEKAFFDGIGIEVRGAVIPEHYNSKLIYAVAGGKYGVVRSGYNGHIYPTVCPYENYSNGPRSNLYGLTSYNIVDMSLANNKAAVDSALANHRLMIVYIHENSLDAAKKAVIEGLMDYVNETGITQITLGDIPNII